jgi:mono/diheme cytochrome c family protein
MNRQTKTLVCFLFVALAGVAAFPRPFAARTQTAASQKVDYARDIAPLFEQSCNSCHGAKKAAGQLRLDVKAPAMKGGMSGAVILPGNSKDSRLMHRLLGLGGEKQMPLGGDPLKSEQIELVRRWIDEGAVWPEAETAKAETGLPRHWAYVKPTQPPPPAVRGEAWVRNAIDRFVLARLEKEGLKPSPEAGKETLLRRVSLDLTGLPPSPKELDDFLADTGQDAYEKAVDRLLASPHYGERWARPWLDLARYADSNGYEKDKLRVMWKYRDWVINALNKDMPFDQFTVEQIAGDMLPNAGVEQLIATGFHRNTLLNQEGGIDPEEARFEVLVDRVNTTGTVWLGSTVACAQCHNHKYDPITQQDFYRLMAFFEGAEYKIGYQTEGAEESRYILEPEISLPTPEQAAKRKAIDDEIKLLTEKLKTNTPALDAAQAAWEKEMLAEQSKWTPLEAVELKATGGATLTKLEDKSVLASGANPELETYVVTARTSLQGITALRLEALPDARLPKGGPGRDPYGNFLLTGLEVVAAPAAPGSRAEAVSFTNGAVDDSAYRFEPKRFFETDSFMGAVDRPRGWYVNATGDEKRVARQAVFVAVKPFGAPGGTTLTVKLKHQGGALGQGIGRFRLSVTTDPTPLKITTVSARLRPVLSIPARERTAKQKADLSAQFRNTTPLLKADRDRLTKLRDELKQLGIVTALVMQERSGYERPATHLRERGSFLNKGAKVYANTPSFLPPLPESAPANRLGLARWLVDEGNPLTSRVAVNRFWEQFFGRGIVETSEDFGSQGAPPSHPELLDYLATEFVRGKWSMKAIHRLIATSATYRQSSAATPALVDKDPYNRLLARGPRFRMEAEMVRDVTLAASGLLSRKVGGPSVFPPQPEGIWKAPYSDDKWQTSAGEDRYRRSLYTFIRRSSPYPSLMTFDATSREVCTVRRVRTNTPLQALVGLNDEAFFEAARGLARRIVGECRDDVRERVTYAFRLCTSRAPKAAELERLTAYYRQQLDEFRADEKAAQRVIQSQLKPGEAAGAAELAAWTMVANVLLNLDETLTKE